MRNLSTIFFIAIMALIAGSASRAATLGKGFVINPDPDQQLQTTLLAVSIAYDYELITLTDPEMTATATFGGKSYEVEPSIFFDYDIAWALGQTNNDPAWGNVLIISFNDEGHLAGEPDGIYTIDVPAGMVKNAEGALNEAGSFSFTKVSPVKPISISPAQGMYAEISDVTLTFDSAVALNPGGGNIELRFKNDFINNPVVVMEYAVSADGKSLVINLDNLMQKGEWYMLSIPETFLKVGEFETNAEIWLEYMWWDGMPQATIISAPAELSDIDVNPLVLTWNFQPIEIAPQAPATEIVIGYPDYGLQDGWRVYMQPSYYQLVTVDKDGNYKEAATASEANGLCLDLTRYVKTATGYDVEVIIPAGVVVNSDNLQNPPLRYSFRIAGTWPAPEISSEDMTISMVWNEAEWVSYGMSDEEVTLTSDEKTYTLPFTFGSDADGYVSLNEEYNGLVIKLDDLDLADGDYVLRVPQGYVYIDGVYGEFVMNGKVEYPFSVTDGEITAWSGIDGVNADETMKIVFDLNGRVAGKNGREGLAPGIYIIGGKKVLITK